MVIVSVCNCNRKNTPSYSDSQSELFPLSTQMWKVCLIANVAQSPISEYEIHAHQDPSQWLLWRNRFESPFNQRWVVLQSIVVDSEKRAFHYRNTWRSQTRGLQRYLAKAFYLANNTDSSLEIVPVPLETHKNFLSPYYHGQNLDWPPCPLTVMMTPQPMFQSEREQYYQKKKPSIPANLQKTNTIADIIRMHDLIQPDILQEIPTSLLERFVKLVTTH